MAKDTEDPTALPASTLKQYLQVSVLGRSLMMHPPVEAHRHMGASLPQLLPALCTISLISQSLHRHKTFSSLLSILLRVNSS